MSKNDNAVLKVGEGNFFVAPVGTKPPTNLTQPGSEWSNIGHTSLKNIMKVEADGGERKILGTLQARNLRTSTSARTEKLKINLHQFDKDSLKLHFGSNMAPTTDDPRFMGVPEAPTPTQVAFMAVFTDGTEIFALWAPKAEVIRSDNMDLQDTEEFSSLPILVTPVKHGNNPFGWSLTPIGMAPPATGATAGAPGAFTPSGSSQPSNLAAMSTVTASPTTKWTVGQYVDLKDGSKAHWNGTAWAAGAAPA